MKVRRKLLMIQGYNSIPPKLDMIDGRMVAVISASMAAENIPNKTVTITSIRINDNVSQNMKKEKREVIKNNFYTLSDKIIIW